MNEETIRADAQTLLSELSGSNSIKHSAVLQEILEQLKEIDFREYANLKSNENITQKHHRVVTVQIVLQTASDLDCGLCRNLDFVYAFNGQYWHLVDRNELEKFLGNAAMRLGVDRITASDYEFKAKLFKQFLTDAYLPAPARRGSAVLINLKNGTFEIDGKRAQLRDFDSRDFLKYQLPFDFDVAATSPKWSVFLDEVLPDKSKQMILAEYCGYLFQRNLKLEKTLLLYGTGANGKSVVFDVTNAMLGKANVTNYSLESLCREYYRAKIANVLLNYSSEISNRIQAEKFKLLTSGEPIEARLPYGQPMILIDYARLIFNCNELPRDVEHSEAFFRRFLILHFDQFIPERKRNPNLAKEIIATELSGVFNWVLDGLGRLLKQNGFSECEAVDKMLESFRLESDSVAMFLSDEHYVVSATQKITLKEVYSEYKSYCLENTYRPLGRNRFAKRLEANAIPREDSYQPFFLIERRTLREESLQKAKNSKKSKAVF